MTDICKEIDQLPPSVELLNYYKLFIKENEKDKEETLALLKRYKELNVSNWATEREKLVEDVSGLKETLSDVNLFIHAERQQVMGLHIQNKKLKGENNLLRKKVDFLMKVSNITENQLNAYLRSSKKGEIIERLRVQNKNKQKFLMSTLKEYDSASEIENHLKVQVKDLEKNFEKAKTSWVIEKNAILEERTLQKAEAKTLREEDQAHLQLLNIKLQDADRLAAEVTGRTIEGKSSLQKAKRVWLSEKEKLLTKLTSLKYRLSKEEYGPDEFNSSLSLDNLHIASNGCEVKHLKREVAVLKRELSENNEMKSLYKSRYRKIEQDVACLREEKLTQQTALKKNLNCYKELHVALRGQQERSEEARRTQEAGFRAELRLIHLDLKKLVEQIGRLASLYKNDDRSFDGSELKRLQSAASCARRIHLAVVSARNRDIAPQQPEIKETDKKDDQVKHIKKETKK